MRGKKKKMKARGWNLEVGERGRPAPVRTLREASFNVFVMLTGTL